ncbi:TlpA family protein disulfide reductase [Sphingobacterium lactis]|uniref:TlpA family protein disulfide reductase n=1 Tax=Sphingobacterium lactis TaxID=797291 RepID=UPI003F81D419
MKTTRILCYALITLCTLPFLSFGQQIEISIKSDNIKPEIRILAPVNGTYFYDSKMDTSLNQQNELKLTYPGSNAGAYIISYLGAGTKLYLNPGDKIHINYTTDANKKVQANISGNNLAGQKLVNTINRPFYQQVAEKYLHKHGSIEAAQDAIFKNMNKEIGQLDSLLKNKEINQAFLDMAAAETRTYNYSLAAFALQDSMYRIKRALKDGLLPDSTANYFVNNWKKVIANYDFHDKHNLNNSSFMDLLEIRNAFEGYYFEPKTFKQVQAHDKKDSYLDFMFYSYTLNPDIVNDEYVTAMLFSNTLMQNNFEQLLVTKFDEFKLKYPNSNYSPYLEPEIQKVREFNQKAAANFSENTHFVKDYESITDFKQVQDYFKDKLVYIDLWATWCGPCKAEFAYNKELSEYTKANNIVKVFISIDRDELDQKWKEMIKYYDLEGYHIRASLDLGKQITEMFSKDFDGQRGFGIPHYIIMKNGEIVQKDAIRPSRLKDLKEQFKTYL